MRKGAISLLTILLIAVGLIGAGYVAKNYGNMKFQAVSGALGSISQKEQPQLITNRTGAVISKLKSVDIKLVDKHGNPVNFHYNVQVLDPQSDSIIQQAFRPYSLKARRTYKFKIDLGDEFYPIEKESYVSSSGRVNFGDFMPAKKSLPDNLGSYNQDNGGGSLRLCNEEGCNYHNELMLFEDKACEDEYPNAYCFEAKLICNSNTLQYQTGQLSMYGARYYSNVNDISNDAYPHAVIYPTVKVIKSNFTGDEPIRVKVAPLSHSDIYNDASDFVSIPFIQNSEKKWDMVCVAFDTTKEYAQKLIQEYGLYAQPCKMEYPILNANIYLDDISQICSSENIGKELYIYFGDEASIKSSRYNGIILKFSIITQDTNGEEGGGGEEGSGGEEGGGEG